MNIVLAHHIWPFLYSCRRCRRTEFS